MDSVDSTSLPEMKKIEDKLDNCIGNKKFTLDMLYFLSHIVLASILITCLKRTQPLVLALILSAILGYVSFTEQDKFPIYALPIAGLTIYLLDLTVISSYLPENVNKTTLDVVVNTSWRAPFFGIISYYVAILVNSK